MGTGIQRIHDLLLNASCKPAEYEYAPFFNVIFRRKEAPVGAPVGAPVEAPFEAPVEAPVKLSVTNRTILTHLITGEKRTKELLAILGYKNKTGNFKNAISKLLKLKLIEMTIPDKPNSRLQKYRLAQIGRNRIL